jgi:hypothetical protein
MGFHKVTLFLILSILTMFEGTALAQSCYNVEDSTLPSAYILTPSSGQQLVGIVEVSYSGGPGAGYDQLNNYCQASSYTMELTIDNGSYVDSTGVYFWDTSQVTNGSHTLTVTVTDSNSGTSSTSVTVNVLNFNQNMGGPFQVGPAVYEASPQAQAHYCGIMDPSYLQLIGVTNPSQQVPTLSAVPTGYHYDGACTPANHIFNVAGTVYYENSSGQYCRYPDPSYLKALAGGQIGFSLDQMPSNLTYTGWCEPLGMNFNVDGKVYYENSNKHYCWFPDPSYLKGLGGGNAGVSLDMLPNDAAYDGQCGPAGMNFNVGGRVYYENPSKHYCWFPDPSYLDGLGGGNGGASLDALPSDGTYDGWCEPAGRVFNCNVGPVGRGAVYYQGSNGHYCWVPGPAYLQRLGGNAGPSLDMMPINTVYDGTCPPLAN